MGRFYLAPSNEALEAELLLLLRRKEQPRLGGSSLRVRDGSSIPILVSAQHEVEPIVAPIGKIVKPVRDSYSILFLVSAQNGALDFLCLFGRGHEV